jgi:hypothetical protein
MFHLSAFWGSYGHSQELIFENEFVGLNPKAECFTQFTISPISGFIGPTTYMIYNYFDLNLDENFESRTGSCGYGTSVKITVGHPITNATYGETSLVETSSWHTDIFGQLVSERQITGIENGLPVNSGTIPIPHNLMPETQLSKV